MAASLWLRMMNARAQAWPSTLGRVIKSELVPDPHDNETNVAVIYEFTVGGRTFTSTRIAFAGMRNDSQSQANLIARFPVGSEVDVYFDPINPTSSALIRSPSNLWQWGVATSLLLAAVAILAP